MKYSLSILLILFAFHTIAQENSNKRLTFSGYGELYYSSDFSKVVDEEKPSFIYNHKKLGVIQMNLAFLKASYSNKTFRGNVALMAGNYPRYNLANEHSWARIIYEANAGIKIVKNRNIWLDGGVMPSHIGFESALGADCWTLTRSLLAENSPYYETGFKLSSASKNEKWNASILALNGWQKIKRPDGIRKPSFGAQINYRPNEKVFVNYSNFVGSDKPDSLGNTRIFHNFYAQIQGSKKLGFILGFDIGSEKNSSSNRKFWYSPVVISRLKLNNTNTCAARIEYYSDAKEIIVSTNTINGFQTLGYSLNFDHNVSRNLLFRIETKRFESKDAIFSRKKLPAKQNLSITTALCLRL